MENQTSQSAVLKDLLKSLGRTFKSARKSLGLSQVVAANKMQVDYRHYQNIEGGKINLRMDTLLRLLNFYNLPLSIIGTNSQLTGSPATKGPWATIELESEVIQEANSAMAELIGANDSTTLKGSSLEKILSREDIEKLKQTVSNTLPPNEIEPIAIQFRNLEAPTSAPSWVIAHLNQQANAPFVTMTVSCHSRSKTSAVRGDNVKLTANF